MVYFSTRIGLQCIVILWLSIILPMLPHVRTAIIIPDLEYDLLFVKTICRRLMYSFCSLGAVAVPTLGPSLRQSEIEADPARKKRRG
jgi:hypothetical protein